MNPAVTIEHAMQRLEHSEPLTHEELDDVSTLLDSVIFRLREVWTDSVLWPEGVAENPLTYVQIKGYLQRLSVVVDASSDARAVATMLKPIRRFADKEFKEFLITNLRKWIEVDDLVVYQLILGLDSIGERPWPAGRKSISTVTAEDRKMYRSDALDYLRNLGAH